MIKLSWVALLGPLLLAAGCGSLLFGPGPADYGYPVAAGYALIRSSGHQISVTPVGGGPRDPARMILPKVTKVAWTDRYVIAEQVELQPRNPSNPDCGRAPGTFVPERPAADSSDCYEQPNGVFHYWILDTNLQRTYGPYDAATFELERQALGLGSLVLKDPRAYAQGTPGQFRP